MKIWLFSIFGLILFIGISFYVQKNIEQASKSLGHELTMIEKYVLNTSWDQTDFHLKQLKKRWQTIKPRWALLIHHYEIDSIEQSLEKTIKAAQIKNYAETLIELGSLQHFIRHIPEREKFNLINIL